MKKENEKWLLVLIPTIIVCLTIIAIVRISQKSEDKRITNEILEEQTRQIQIEQCNITAYGRYSEQWDNTCLLIGRTTECALPSSYADELDQSYQDELDRCLIRYSK